MYEIGKLKKLTELQALAPRAMAGLRALDVAALGDGAIPKKYKELIAIAVALTLTFVVRSAWSKDFHVNAVEDDKRLAAHVHRREMTSAGGADEDDL